MKCPTCGHEEPDVDPVLLPCPFCGGNAEYEYYSSEEGTYLVLCPKCEISTIQGTKAAGAATWNKRLPNTGSHRPSEPEANEGSVG